MHYFLNLKVFLLGQFTFIICCDALFDGILGERVTSSMDVAETLADDESDGDDMPIKFSLFNRKLNEHYEEWQTIEADNQLPNSWTFGGPIKVLIHGFTLLPFVGIEGQHYVDLARALGKANSYSNIILVDWTCCSDGAYYPRSARNTRMAGTKLAKWLVSLKSMDIFSSWDEVHIIGFSLGAHVAGIAGYLIQNSTGDEKVGRITGLDPAGPLFDVSSKVILIDETGSLDKSDAKFVDVIHCNMGISNFWLTSPLKGALGTMIQRGHVDFYPNGGAKQQFYCGIKKQKIGCSHLACVTIYAGGLFQPQLACPCPSWSMYNLGKCKCSAEKGNKYGPSQYIGEYCSPEASGKYFLAMGADSIPEKIKMLIKL